MSKLKKILFMLAFIGLTAGALKIQVCAISQASVENQLTNYINQFNGKTANANQWYMGTQCKGFANWIFKNIFGVYIGGYPESANYKITNPQAETIGVIEPGNLTESTAKELLQKGKPGDYIQVQRSIAKSGGKCGPHSMILVGVKADGVQVFDCNSDGKNTVKTYLYTWSKFDYDNRAMSLYHANGYEISAEPAPVIPTGEQTISDGKYYIASADNERYCISIQGGSREDGANALMYQNEQHESQIFDVTYLGNGAYRISSMLSGRSLDVDASDTSPGTNVAQFSSHDGYNQQWIIKESGDGRTYYVISKCNGLYLDVEGGNICNDANVDVYTGHGGGNEKWRFLPYYNSEARTIPDGKYIIASGLDNSYCIDIEGSSEEEANAILYKNEQHENQYFDVTYLEDGSYMIQASHSKKVLDVYDNGIYKGTTVKQYRYEGGENQKWFIRNVGNGNFYIVSKLNNMYLDVSGSVANNNVDIITWAGHGKMGQQWKFIPVNTPDLTVDTSGSQVVFNWKNVEWADNYTVHIKDSNENDYSQRNLKSNTCGVDLPEGTYTAYVDGSNSYFYKKGNEVTFYWNPRIDIAGCEIMVGAAYYAYDASPQTPSVTVKNGTTTLVEGTDYTITYSNNTNAGTATATITGTGSYTGTISRNFTINKANQTINASISASTIQEGATAQVTAGGEGTKTYTSSNPSVATVDASGLVTGRTAGTAVITVTAAETSNYFSATATVSVTVTHAYGSGTVTTEATCTQDGVRTYTCSGCGKTYTEAIRAKGHSYAESVTGATCTERGYTTHTCSACGDSYRNLYVDALGHQFDQGVVTKAPTGDTDGIRTYTCSRCRITREETIPATGHTYDNGTVTKEATCMEAGIRTYRCSDCGRTYTEEIPSLGHRYETAVTAPSCTKKGYTTHTCAVCGDSYKDSYTDAAGHSYNDGEVAEEAACTEEGLKIYTCVNCRNQYTELIPASGHQYEERVTAPSCTKKGYTTHTCTVCRYSYKDDYTNALGHSYDEGEIVEEPTCTEEGLQRYTCLRCQNQYTETIAAAGHQYVSIVTEPGCTEKGYTTHACTACGESYQDSYVNATGHDYDEGEVVEEPTCTEEGLQRYTCLRCRNQYTETIAAAGHRWDNGEIITAATASSTGRKMYICGECGEKKIETIPALSDEKEQKPSNPETNTPPQENQTERHLTAGETVSVGSSCYRVTASGKTVEYAGCLMDGITFIGIPKKVVLHGVTYPVTGIADRAFAKNQKLMTVLIPEGVRVIGDAAFENCKSLKKVTIPSSVEKIGKRAFYGCRRLANLTIKTKKLTKKKVGEKAFTKAGSASYKKLKVKVPKVKRKAYQGLLKKKGLSPKAKMK